MPTTEVIHSDVVGTSYTAYAVDYRRLKAVRKFIVYSDRTDLKLIIADLSTNIAGLPTDESATPLGPRWIETPDVDNTENIIVHPDDNELPIGTVDITSIGDRRYLVTAKFFVQPSTGGDSQVANTMSLRTELVATRKYEQSGNTANSWFATVGAGESPLKYSYVCTVPQIRVKIPFFTYTNPLADLTAFNYLGGLNSESNLSLGGMVWAMGALRFDGISMDEFGSVVTTDKGTYKFKGYYEFTARGGGDGWDEQVPVFQKASQTWVMSYERPSISHNSAWTKVNIFGV